MKVCQSLSISRVRYVAASDALCRWTGEEVNARAEGKRRQAWARWQERSGEGEGKKEGTSKQLM